MNKMLVLKRSMLVLGWAYELAGIVFYWFIAYTIFKGLGFMVSFL